MIRATRSPTARLLLASCAVLAGSVPAAAENIDPEGDGSKYAWSENAGWSNARPLGEVVLGVWNDRIGGKRSLIICFILLLGSLLWLQVAEEAWMLFLFAVVYGLAHGGFFTVMSPMIAELFGTGSHGLLFGVVLACGTVGGALGPLLAGRTFDVTGSYRIIFVVLTALVVLGFILIVLLRPQHSAE